MIWNSTRMFLGGAQQLLVSSPALSVSGLWGPESGSLLLRSTVWCCFHGRRGWCARARVCVSAVTLPLSLITLIYGCLSTRHSASAMLSLDGSWWFVFLSVIGFIRTDPTHCVSYAARANKDHITRRETFACFCDKLSNFREKVLSGSAPSF